MSNMENPCVTKYVSFYLHVIIDTFVKAKLYSSDFFIKADYVLKKTIYI